MYYDLVATSRIYVHLPTTLKSCTERMYYMNSHCAFNDRRFLLNFSLLYEVKEITRLPLLLNPDILGQESGSVGFTDQ